MQFFSVWIRRYNTDCSHMETVFIRAEDRDQAWERAGALFQHTTENPTGYSVKGVHYLDEDCPTGPCGCDDGRITSDFATEQEALDFDGTYQQLVRDSEEFSADRDRSPRPAGYSKAAEEQKNEEQLEAYLDGLHEKSSQIISRFVQEDQS